MLELDLSVLNFGPDGLIPAIVQDIESGQVLMMAYMDREALQLSLRTGRTWFFSRSRKRLWQKGETSGHYQDIRQILYDCDHDTLLIKAEQTGAACHEGFRSCFHYSLTGEANGVAAEGGPAESLVPGGLPEGGRVVGERVFAPDQVYRAIGPVLEELYGVVADRQNRRPEGSYTTYLFDKGLDKILKKVGEETSEVIIAAKNGSEEELTYETADLLYHLLVLLVSQGVNLNDVARELIGRRR